MLNQAKEELNKLIQRLEMLFQIQTHEVVQDLKKIRELLNNPEEIQAPKTPKVNKEEIKEEPKQEIVEDIEIKQPEETQQPTQQTTPEVKNEESKEELVKRYIEKFQKKPFA
jgi:hypothetical protein